MTQDLPHRNKPCTVAASPVKRGRDEVSREIVAFQYIWNTGDLELFWIKSTENDVLYENLPA